MKPPHRKSPQLKGYDYSKPNYYFVTICTDERKDIFGEAQNLNLFGKIADKRIRDIEKHYDGIFVDDYVIMPNHIHLIIVINNKEERS